MSGPLKNPRHEKFAVLVAGGSTQSDAYREVYPGSKMWKDKSVHEKSAQLAAKVRSRVDELKQAVADQVSVTKAKTIEFLASIMQTPVGELHDKSPIAQKIRVRPDGTVEIEMPSKIAAVAEMAKMLGWYEAEKKDLKLRFKPSSDVLDALGDD